MLICDFCPALTAIEHRLLWDIVAKVMIRARGLKAIKIEGAQLTWVQPWVDYIGCNLKCLILRYVSLSVSPATTTGDKPSSARQRDMRKVVQLIY